LIELRKVIESKIAALVGNDKVYFEEAPQERNINQFPYVTFWLPTSLEAFQREDFNLEVNVWDLEMRSDYDPDDIDSITNSIDGDGGIKSPTGMHRYKVYTPDVLQVRFYRANRLMIPDPDPMIKRRQLVYLAKTYFL
jgi:hypothetical protein